MSKLTEFISSLGRPNNSYTRGNSNSTQELENLARDVSGAPKASDYMGGDAEDPRGRYQNRVLPIAAIIEAIASKGQGTAAMDQIKMLGDMPMKKAAYEEQVGSYRDKALARQLGIEKTGREKQYRADVEKDPSKIVDLYTKFNPVEAGKSAFDADLELKKLLASPERMTDFQRKVKELRSAYPDKSDKDIINMALVPSSQIGPSAEKIEGAGKLAESQALGANTPNVGEAKAGVAKTVESATIPPKLALEQGKSNIDIATSGKKTQQDIDIKKGSGTSMLDNVIASATALSEGNPEMVGGGVGGMITRGLNKAGSKLAGDVNPASAHDDVMKANASVIAKSIAQASGAQSEGDIARALNMLPLSSDPLPVFKAKTEFIKTISDQTISKGDKKKSFDALYTKLYGGTKASTGSTDAPKAGDVVDGYTFKGGDPSLQSNWVQE